MSLATDGFSAMMSFLAMRRERPQMISANAPALQPPGLSRARTRVRAREISLVRQPVLRAAEDFLGDELAGRRLLIPQHHQHDQLQLLDGQRSARCGEGTLQDELAVLRREDARLLEREKEAAALRVELGELARRESAEGALRIRQRHRLGERRARHAGKPVQSFADVGMLETRGRELLRDALTLVSHLALLAVLEQIDQDLVHATSLLL